MSTYQEALAFVKNALSNKQSVDRAYMGVVPNSVAGRILKETGVDVSGYGVMMNGNDVRHILKGHGDSATEAAQGQTAVTEEAIAQIPKVIATPDNVYLSTDSDGKGRRAIVFEKQIGDTYITIQGVSDGKKLLQADTMYIRKRKTRKSQDTMPGAENAAPVINARSELPLSLSSDINVPQGAADVNTQGGTEYTPLRMPTLDAAPSAAETDSTQSAQQTVEQMDAEFDAMAAEARAKQQRREAEGYEMPETLRRLGVDPFGSEADYAGAETLAREARNNNSARKQMQKRISKMAFTEKERTFARQLASDKITWQDVPPTMDMERLATLTDFYRTMDNDPAAGLLSRRRNTILERETAKMEPLLGMDVTYDEGGMTDTGKRSGKIAKKFSTLRRNLQTPARVCETEWGAAHGREVYDALFYPVTENNGRQITWVNSMLDRVRTFTDSTGKKRALNRKERELVQKLVEYSASQDRVAKFSGQYAPAVENVRNGAGVEDSAREFGIDKSSQEYADLLNYKTYLTAAEELAASTEADAAAVQAAVKAYSDIYKELYEGINTFLVAHGYQPIGFIEGYAPHLQPESERTAFSKALKMLGLDDAAMELPTSISGQTADLKPYKQYNPFFQERRGDKTEYDIAKGFENYVY